MRRKPRSSEAAPQQELLPEAELEVLAALGALGDAPVGQIREWLRPFRPMSHASVSTLLQRLEAKGLVTRRKADRGKAYLYSATNESPATLDRAAGRVLRRLFGNDSARLMASLLGAHEPTADELERLKDLVDTLYDERHGEDDR